jgi:hypothetical protein
MSMLERTNELSPGTLRYIVLVAVCINAVWIRIVFAVSRLMRLAILSGLTWKVSGC